MRSTKQVVFLVVLTLLGLTVLGCGRGSGVELAKVYGTVTLDGEPLAGAHVYFRAQGSRPSVGEVDDKGHYEAMFTHNEKGVKVGPCTVSIAWPTGVSGPAIPKEYALMDREIKEGKNELDFELKSE